MSCGLRFNAHAFPAFAIVIPSTANARHSFAPGPVEGRAAEVGVAAAHVCVTRCALPEAVQLCRLVTLRLGDKLRGWWAAVDRVHPMKSRNEPTRPSAPRAVLVFLAAAIAVSCVFSLPIREAATASAGAAHASSNIAAGPVSTESISMDNKLIFAGIPMDY